MKTLKIGFVFTLICLAFGSNAQSVSAISEKITVDYSLASPSILEIISPDILASDTRGFKQVSLEQLEIKGVATNKAGVKSLTLNKKTIELSSTGLFTTLFNLYEGDNLLTFEIIDNRGGSTVKEFVVNRSGKSSDEVETGRYFALIIGVEEYDDPKITDLDNPLTDATALYNLLTSKYTFELENAVLLKNPKRADIFDELDRLSATITDKDNLLIFYAGHGYWDAVAENGYWLPSDAEEGKKRDWMSNSSVTEYVREIKSHHTLLITDACFGGSIFKTRKAFQDASMGINKLYEIPSRKAMTSGTLTEVPDKSVFMKYLLKQLDTNDLKHIASEQVFYNIKPAVLNNSPSTPQFGVMQGTGDEGGDFIFIQRDL